MSMLAEKILASRKVFLIYLTSFYALWLGKHITDQYLTSLGKQIYSEHLIDKVRFFDSLHFVFTICQYLFLIQFFILIFCLIYKFKKPIERSDRSILFDTAFTSLTILNSALVLFLILIRTLVFVPSKATFFIILLIVFFSALGVSYWQNSEAEEIESAGELLKDSLLNKLISFGFPHFREIFAISWAMAFLVGIFQLGHIVPQHSFLSWIIINLLPFLIVVTGTIYFILGSIFRVNKLDELERHIYYEKSSIVFMILIGVMLSFILLRAFFQISFEFPDFAIIMGPAVLISDLFIRAKYS